MHTTIHQLPQLFLPNSSASFRFCSISSGLSFFRSSPVTQYKGTTTTANIDNMNPLRSSNMDQAYTSKDLRQRIISTHVNNASTALPNTNKIHQQLYVSTMCISNMGRRCSSTTYMGTVPCFCLLLHHHHDECQHQQTLSVISSIVI